MYVKVHLIIYTYNLPIMLSMIKLKQRTITLACLSDHLREYSVFCVLELVHYHVCYI